MTLSDQTAVLPGGAVEGDEADLFFLFPNDNAQFYVAGLSLSPNYSSEPTENEIEDGTMTTDHVNLPPISVTISGVMTDIQSNREGAYDKEFIGLHVTFRERMIQAWASREIIGVDAGPVRGIYDGVIDFNPSWDASSGRGLALEFDLTLKQIKTTKTAVRELKGAIDVKSINKKEQKQLAKPKPKGTASQQLVTDPTQNEKILGMQTVNGKYPSQDWARGN